jgi:hypothetical protein
MDKLAMWLAAQRATIALAPAVLLVISECLQAVQGHTAAAADATDGAMPHAEQQLLVTRALDCSAAWFRLGVLFTMPASVFECVVRDWSRCTMPASALQCSV